MKSLAERLLLVSGAPRLSLHARRDDTLVLAYHNVVPDGELPCGDRSLHLPQAAFASQLDALTERHCVIPLSAINDEPNDGRPRAVITFDDAYRGAITVGVAELQRRGLPATVFVAPSLLGTATWWDGLSDEESGMVPRAVRGQALARYQGRTGEVLRAFGRRPAMPSWATIATEDEVLAAASTSSITLGSHSWTHPNLTTLEASDLAAEMERPLAWLRRAGSRGLPWLAYPYGLTSPSVARAAAVAGYAGAFRIDGGWLRRAHADQYNLPRLNLPSGPSLAGFKLRTSGLL